MVPVPWEPAMSDAAACLSWLTREDREVQYCATLAVLISCLPYRRRNGHLLRRLRNGLFCRRKDIHWSVWLCKRYAAIETARWLRFRNYLGRPPSDAPWPAGARTGNALDGDSLRTP